MASILDCYLSNPEKSHIPKYSKILGHLVKLTEILVDKNYKPTDPRTSMNLKHKKHEEDYLKSHLNQLLKISGKQKIFHIARRKYMSHTEKLGKRKKKKKNKFLYRNNTNRRPRSRIFKDTKRKDCQLIILYPANMSFKN